MSFLKENSELNNNLALLINIGEKLVDKCELHKYINGIGKLLKNCKAELSYLKKLSQKEKFSEAVLKSSNLSNLQGIALCAEHLPGVVGVLRPLQVPDSPQSIVVDVVCNAGRTWVKVITKNSKALLANVNEQCHFGTRSITDQATRYLKFARLHPFQFKVPEVMFIFFHPMPQKMEEGLTQIGIVVCRSEDIIPKDLLSSELCCNIFSSLAISDNESKATGNYEFEEEEEDFGGAKDLDDYDDCKNIDDDDDEEEEEEESEDENIDCCNSTSFTTEEDSSLSEYPEMITTLEFLQSICHNDACICKSYVQHVSDDTSNSYPLVHRVNLDVTSLIAIVSNLCHGQCNYKFRENYLTLQAQDEKINPTLPKVFDLFLGRALFSCQTAIQDFEKIVSIVGGAEERRRAERLLKGIYVVPDLSSSKCDKLQGSARINPRMRRIFGTGDGLRAITCTANNGFVRASRQAGVDFVAFIHPARALTEQKQDAATKI